MFEKIAQRLPVDVSALESMQISVTSFRNVIAVSVHARNPELAAIIANLTADTFITELQNRQLSQLAQFQKLANRIGNFRERILLALMMDSSPGEIDPDRVAFLYG